ncbi:C40 family peptidase [Pseudonocardia sp. NPDC049154]|uniref:C40 family peptidase n=1 Tax=Pseudonocardia sp. NPDC049154 TaxID=3155501 RepID=UPI0033CA7F5B
MLQAAAAGSAAAMLGAVIAVVRREAVIPDLPAPPMTMTKPEVTGTLPAIPVVGPAGAVEAAASAATPPPTTTATPPPTTTARRTTPPPATRVATQRAVAEAVPTDASMGQRIIATARLYFGVPYVWGGTSRAGLDCSGLTYLVLRAHGYNPPRTAATQANWTTRISAAQARPGDLVFENYPATHVGIYIGNGRMIDAATFGTVVGERAVRAGMYFGRLP